MISYTLKKEIAYELVKGFEKQFICANQLMDYLHACWIPEKSCGLEAGKSLTLISSLSCEHPAAPDEPGVMASQIEEALPLKDAVRIFECDNRKTLL